MVDQDRDLDRHLEVQEAQQDQVLPEVRLQHQGEVQVPEQEDRILPHQGLHQCRRTQLHLPLQIKLQCWQLDPRLLRLPLKYLRCLWGLLGLYP
jgi:hypothetical protein